MTGAPLLLACSVCFGKSDAPMAVATNLGIFMMLGVVAGEKDASDPDRRLLRRETLELVRAYYGITDIRLRRRLYEMAKAMRG